MTKTITLPDGRVITWTKDELRDARKFMQTQLLLAAKLQARHKIR